MKNTVTSLLLLMISIIISLQSCKNKTEKTSEKKSIKKNETNSESDTTKNKIEIGYHGTFEKLPKFEIDSTTETEFNAQTKTKDFVEEKIEKSNNHFYIQTSKQKLKFKEYGDNEHNGSEYLGFNKNLDVFAVQNNSVAEGLGFAELTLIHRSTNFVYEIISLGDWSVSLPKISMNNKFMVYFQNPEYESKTLSIAVLKIDKTQPPRHFLKEYSSCFVDNGLSIEEIRWKNDDEIYFKMYESNLDENGNEFKTYQYHFAKIN